MQKLTLLLTSRMPLPAKARAIPLQPLTKVTIPRLPRNLFPGSTLTGFSTKTRPLLSGKKLGYLYTPLHRPP